MLNHFYAADYLTHISKVTESDIKSFTVDGLLVNFFRRKGYIGEVINSSPFYGSHGGFHRHHGPILRSYEPVQMNSILNWLTREGVASITIVENPYCSPDETIKNLELIQLLKCTPQVAYQKIDRLSFVKHTESIKDVDELMKSYHSKSRNCVRKYLKSDSRINVYDKHSLQFDEIMSWLATEHIHTIGAKNGRAKPLKYFDGIKENYGKNRFEVRVAQVEDEPVGALLNFKLGNFYEYWTPVITDLGKSVNAMHGLIHHTLRDLIGKKGGSLNFGGSWESQHDLKRFKARFGSAVCQYSYHCFVMSDSVFEQTPLELNEHYPYFFVREY